MLAECLRSACGRRALTSSQLASLAPPPTFHEHLGVFEGEPYTFFAPNNDAMSALTAELGESSDAVEKNFSLLSALVKYHIVPGEAVMSFVLQDGDTLNTSLADAPPLFILKNDTGCVFVSAPNVNASVVRPDIITCHGVMHVVDAVLLPNETAKAFASM